MRAKPLIHVMEELDVRWVVEIVDSEQHFNFLNSLIGEVWLLGLYLHFEIRSLI